ncbi:T9SS type A sorting domain-containing protein [Flavobacterium suncheonense]|nr:T9SS type A sorting domain-containing protein [Flavobacterium suncheonense]
MKKITLLIVTFMLGLFGVYAQSASTYVFTSSMGTYTDNSGAATTLAGVRADTFISAAQNIGFTFVYEGVPYTQFKMSSNGFISLNTVGTSSLTTNDFSTANATSRPILAPLWDDLDGSGPATSLASYEVTGSAPNRVLTVEWKNWEWNYSSTSAVISFQVKLYETTNEIEFVYRQEATAVASGSASIGIGSATGSGSGSYLNLTSVTAPAVSSTASTTNINTKPATGQIFKFTPPPVCTGTPVAGTATPANQTLVTGYTPAVLTVSGQSTGVSGLTYQWEQSTDGGSNWVNAIGGTGATTLSYTPPAFSGTPILYRLNITCTASSENAYSSVASLTPCGVETAPTATETFATYLPTCWSVKKGALTASSTLTGTTSEWMAEAGFGNAGSNAAVRINLYGGSVATPDNDWIISNSIDLGPTPSLYRIKYKIGATTYLGSTVQTTLGTHVVRVVVSTDNGATWSNANVIKTYTGAGTYTVGQEETVNLIGYSGVVKIGFLATTTSTSPDIDFHIDDFQVELMPACSAPTALGAGNFTNNSASLYWTAGGTESAWNIEWGPTGFTQGTGTVVNGVANPYLLSGLAASTTYQYYVQADCTANGTSTWAGPYSFTTTCDPVTTLPHTEGFDAPANPSCWSTALLTGTTNWAPDDASDGVPSAHSGARFAGKSWAGNDDALLISPPYDLSAYAAQTVQLNVWIYRSTNGLSTDRVTFYANNNNNLTGATQLLDIPLPISAAPTVASAGWYNYTVNIPLSFNTSGVFYVIARGRTTSSFSSYSVGFDDYVLELGPVCPMPTALGADVTDASASLYWTAGGTESAWNIEWGPTGFTQGTGTVVNGVANPYLLSGLAASTTYQYYVQADCTANGTSTWAGPYSFTTTCAPASIPYTQNFESATVPNLPSCTSQVNLGSGNSWTVENNPGYGFTTKTLRYRWNTTSPANVWFFTQGVNLTAGQEYKISYNYGNAGTTFPEKLKVAYGTSNSPAAMVNTLADYPNINQATIQSDLIVFTPAADGVYYFGFQAYSAADQFYLFVDNIVVDVNLGTSAFDASSFKAFPNPVTNVLNLSYSSEISSVEVFNMLGQKVLVKELNVAQGQIDMSNLNAGNYLVKVTADGQTKTIKVIKQ